MEETTTTQNFPVHQHKTKTLHQKLLRINIVTMGDVWVACGFYMPTVLVTQQRAQIPYAMKVISSTMPCHHLPASNLLGPLET